MRSFPIQLSACAIAAAALLSACGGGGTTPGTVNTAAVSGSTGACTAAPCINFAETNLGMVDFGTLGIAVANDPADATNKVAKLTKTTGSEDWAGVTVHLGGAGNSVTRIDPALGITLRVYSPAVGKTILVKIENASNDTQYVEARATSTKAGEWETLTFTYPSPNAGTTYNKVSVFPGFGTKLNEIYYIDELKYTAKADEVVPPSSSLTLLNFDETQAATLAAFEGTSFAAELDGTNKVAKLTKPMAAQPWGGATFTTCAAGTIGAMPAIPFTSNLQTISIRVKAPRAGVTFSLEAKDTSNQGNLVFAQASNTGTDWETLNFNFANKTFGTAINPSQTYNQLSIFPNFDKANEGSAARETADRVYYFDDVKLVGSTATLGTCPAAPVSTSPTNAPTAPTENGSNVISIFSDAFTTTAGVNLNPGWGQSTAVTTESIASNNVLKLANFNYQGIDFNDNRINVSSKTHLHVDVWSDTATSVAVSLIGPNSEKPYTVNLTANAWTSVNIPLSSYDTVDKTAVRQLKFESTPSGSTVFLDNIYFK
jgi:hypothetical protein